MSRSVRHSRSIDSVVESLNLHPPVVDAAPATKLSRPPRFPRPGSISLGRSRRAAILGADRTPHLRDVDWSALPAISRLAKDDPGARQDRRFGAQILTVPTR